MLQEGIAVSENSAAQFGVLKAIQELHRKKLFTKVLNELKRTVFPKYRALLERDEDEHDVLDPSLYLPARRSSGLGSYSSSAHNDATQKRKAAGREFEEALIKWARQFRLTCDQTDSGECPAWILDYGRNCCASNSVLPRLNPPDPIQMHPPGGPSLPAPLKGEQFPKWRSRINHFLRGYYVWARRFPLARPYRDPFKRKPDHYRWFVLSVCEGLSASEIADRLHLETGSDTVRKGVKSVSLALSGRRK